MRKFSLILLVLLLAVSFWNCEKDDICADGNANTTFMVIEFYDAANPTVLKEVTNLGVGDPAFVTRFSFTGVSKIEVPLRTNATTSTLNFIENGGDEDHSLRHGGGGPLPGGRGGGLGAGGDRHHLRRKRRHQGQGKA